jgi:hypothetical protein
MRATVAESAGEVDIAVEMLKQTERLFVEAGDEKGALLAQCARSGLKGPEHDIRKAVVLLDSAIKNLGKRRHRALHTALLHLRLQLQMRLAGGGQEEEQQWTYEHLSADDALLVHSLSANKMLARYYAAQQHWTEAEAAYRRVTDVAVKLDETWLDEEDRSRFRRAQGPLLAEAREYFQRQGNRDAEQLAEPFPSADERRHKHTEAQERAARRLAWIGGTLVVLNLLCAAGSALADVTGSTARWTRIVWVWLLVFSGFPTLFWLILALFISGARKRTGWVLLVLAMLPWILAVTLVVAWCCGL